MKLFMQLTRVGLQSLAANKLRSVLTMLGVIIGVGAVIVMVSIGEGAKQSVSRNIKSLGTNLLIVRPGFDRRGPVRSGSVQTLTEDDAKAIATQVPDVAKVSPELGQSAQVKYLAKNVSTTVMGATEAFAEVNNFKLADGRFIDQEDLRASRKVAVLGATVATELFGGAAAVGETVKVKGQNYSVIGVLEAKGQSGYRDPDDQIVVPLSTAQKRLLGVKHLRSVNIQVASEKAMDGAQAAIEGLLRQRHRIRPGAPSDFTIRNQKEILETMSQVGDTFTALLAAVAAVSMLIGGIGIMNIMLVSVTERTREIGIRKAVGARGRDILVQFLVEAVVLSVLGGLVGIGAGIGLSKAIGASGSWETSIAPNSILLSFGVAAATGIFFGLYPARKASKLDPIEALRYE